MAALMVMTCGKAAVHAMVHKALVNCISVKHLWTLIVLYMSGVSGVNATKLVVQEVQLDLVLSRCNLLSMAQLVPYSQIAKYVTHNCAQSIVQLHSGPNGVILSVVESAVLHPLKEIYVEGVVTLGLEVLSLNQQMEEQDALNYTRKGHVALNPAQSIVHLMSGLSGLPVVPNVEMEVRSDLVLYRHLQSLEVQFAASLLNTKVVQLNLAQKIVR
jgi:hypothetical protein